MKWENWLSQLEALPADDAVWNDFDDFVATATQVANGKRHQRDSARTALEDLLLSLQERSGEVLSRLGWADLSRWQSQECSVTQALQLVTPLNQLQQQLEEYSEAMQQVPATPQEFQALRRTRNVLEDEILYLGSTLDAFFTDPQAETLESAAPTAIAPEPEPLPETSTPEVAPTAHEPITSPEVAAPVDGSAPSAVLQPPPAIEPTQVLTPPLSVVPPSADSPSSTPAIVTPPPAPIVPLTLAVEPFPVNAPSASIEPSYNVAPIDNPVPVVFEPTTVPASAVAPTLAEPSGNGTEPQALSEPAPSQEILPPPLEPELEEAAPEEAEAPVEPEAPVAATSEVLSEPDEAMHHSEASHHSHPHLPSVPVPERSEAEATPPAREAQLVQGEVLPPAEERSRRLRIFISSPGDVGQERVIAMRVIERLQPEFSAYLDLEAVLWEHEPLRATGHFQEQILAPSLSDIVVCILWSRLGTRLPAKFQRADGTLYASGTEWEFEDALSSYKERGTPDLMVYRKSAEPHASMSDERALLERLAQKRALDTFIDRWFGNPQESFKAAFHQFHSPDEFEQVLENHLRKLIGERLPKHITEDGVTGAIRWHKGSPFRGLKAFEPEHAPVFFGRTRAISEVGAQLTSCAVQGCAFVVVFGMSGSGKSSLVKAGLLPTLTQPGVVEGVGLWRWAITMPSETRDPIYGLALALLQENALPELQEQGLDATELAALLREAPQRVVGPLRAALKTTAEKTAELENLHEIPLARLAVVVDQLEEVFTQEGLDPEERRRFIVVLQVLARSGIVWVMATMRSDFFMRCAEVPELMELKEGLGQYHLLPPTFAELSQILTQPARSAGLRFEVDSQTGERLSDVLQDAAGKDPGALPLLEFTLDELFQKRTSKGVLTFDAYRELGGIEGALGRRAEEVFLAQPVEVQSELPAMLRAIVTVSEANNASQVQIGARRALQSQLTQTAERRQLMEAFVAARLLVIDKSEGALHDGARTQQENEASTEHGVVRVAHEALLRHWPRLQQWLSEDLEFLRTRARVMNGATQWSESNRLPEYLLRQGRPLSEAEELLLRRQAELEPATVSYIQESRRMVRRARNLRLGVVTGVLVTFMAVVSGFGLFSFAQWKKTERQKQMALTAVNRWTYDVPEKLAGIAATRPALKSIFQENIQLLNNIEEMDPQTSGVKREKAANLDRMGDTWMLLGDSNQSKQAYQQSLAILTGLAKSEGTPASKRDLATSLEKIGDTRQLDDDLKGALEAFDESLALRRELSNAAPTPDIKRELSVSYEKMGGVKRALKDYEGCRANLKQAWELRSEVAQNSKDPQAQRDLFVCAVGIGDSYLDEGQTKEARQEFENILPLARKNSESGTPEARRDLSALYDRLGDVRVNEGKPGEALSYYRQSLAISQDLARNQDDVQAQRDLLTSWQRIGAIQVSSGEVKAALESFAKALPLAQNLARDTDNLEAQQGLMDCYTSIGDIQLQTGGLMLAHAAYQRALRQYKQIKARWPKDAHSRSQAASAYGQLAYLKLQFRQPKDAIAAATQGVALAPEERWISVNLIEAYAFSGQLPKAQALCLKYRNEKIGDATFKQAVLTDIRQLEGAGLSNAGLVALRDWLLKNRPSLAA